MDWNNQTCYRAICRRDWRFDGKFFTAVLTTGIYCRPVCPARTPKKENVRFFSSAAAAEGAGFRPCRRCRPESSPGTPAWNGTSATVRRALRLIAKGATGKAGVERLAEKLGVTSRHLRRLFATWLGASPVALAQARRLTTAHQLAAASRLPIGTIALAAGFKSLRRFNEAFQAQFRQTPSQVRHQFQLSKGGRMSRVTKTVRSPLGPIYLEASEKGLCTLHFGASRPRDAAGPAKRGIGSVSSGKRNRGASPAGKILEKTEKALKRYFAGNRRSLERLPVDASGTEFQRKVWRALCEIPAGQTRSYADIAKSIGRPKAFRAVGMANHSNPVAIVVPCHRVIASDGSLAGYGGKVFRKEWLLKHEGAIE